MAAYKPESPAPITITRLPEAMLESGRNPASAVREASLRKRRRLRDISFI